MDLQHQVNRIRWFLLPEEAWQYGHGRTSPVTQRTFNPKVYLTRNKDHLKTQEKQQLPGKNSSFRLQYSQKERIEEVKTVYTVQINPVAPQPSSPTAPQHNPSTSTDPDSSTEPCSYSHIGSTPTADTGENEINLETGIKIKKHKAKGILKFKSIFKRR